MGKNTIVVYGFESTKNRNGAIYISTKNTAFQSVEPKVSNPTSIFTLFPNPIENRVSITFENSLKTDISIAVYSSKGQLVYSNFYKNFQAKTCDLNLPTSLEKGLYFITVKTLKGTSSKVFLKN